MFIEDPLRSSENKKRQNGNEEAKVMFLQILKLPLLFLRVCTHILLLRLCGTRPLDIYIVMEIPVRLR